ncbi:flagellin [Methanolacinia petrolearia DSM 11571]|uniref:Flagellin n=1 Tax=Methanolacinia petrolearia (strain DSM 11571 / OCM 486 / SEBR 4847) TaxID=679926 RepID=E1RJG0_METP4|nr:archaellin/type IV pilin N-terminal domain-containing protein [Methanolacinia petrolearia]ADN36766.1 flagellin [Methanolacinia petrolearia DSM 11571]
MKLNKEEAFTGLEAAIVLIAFVVVAAVFSYVVLGAGFFTTQKAQEVVYTSVDQASSSIEILGDVYGIGDSGSSSTYIDLVRFTVGLTAGGSAIDFSQTTLTYSDKNIVFRLDNVNTTGLTDYTTVDTAVGCWGVIRMANNDSSDLLLESQEQFTILVNPIEAIDTNQDFEIQIRPAVGTAYAIERSAPARITGVNTLY